MRNLSYSIIIIIIVPCLPYLFPLLNMVEILYSPLMVSSKEFFGLTSPCIFISLFLQGCSRYGVGDSNFSAGNIVLSTVVTYFVIELTTIEFVDFQLAFNSEICLKP